MDILKMSGYPKVQFCNLSVRILQSSSFVMATHIVPLYTAAGCPCVTKYLATGLIPLVLQPSEPAAWRINHSASTSNPPTHCPCSVQLDRSDGQLPPTPTTVIFPSAPPSSPVTPFPMMVARFGRSDDLETMLGEVIRILNKESAPAP